VSLFTRTFALLLAATFASSMSFSALLPTLPRYADGPLDAGGLGIGLAVGGASLTAFLGQPLAGRLSDRRGRRLLLVSGPLVMAAASAAYVLADTLPVLVLLRLLAGCGEALFFVGAFTMQHDLAPDERRGEATSYLTLALYGGLAAGPLAGDLILGGDRYDTVWLASAAGALVAFLIALSLPETKPADAGQSSGGRFFYAGALPVGLVLLAGLLAFGGFNAFVALYALELGFERTGLVFATFAIAVIAVRSFGARLPDLLGPKRAGFLALAGIALGMALIAAWPSVPGLFAGTLLLAAGQSLAFPALMTFAVSAAPVADRSAAIGTVSAFIDLGIVSGAVVCGLVVDLSGYRAAFLVGGAIAAGGLLLLARLR